MPYGLQSMLKDGHQHLSGLDEAVIKNIEACRQLSKITCTSLGPNGAWRELASCSPAPGGAQERRLASWLFPRRAAGDAALTRLLRCAL